MYLCVRVFINRERGEESRGRSLIQVNTITNY